MRPFCEKKLISGAEVGVGVGVASGSSSTFLVDATTKGLKEDTETVATPSA